MTSDQVGALGDELAEFLGEFADCFRRSEPRGKLAVYVRGQLGELPRKSVEPMALAAGMRPRTLQEFLASDEWDEERLRAHIYRLVARDHHDDQLIGVIDESGHPKKGAETAGVGRQYCGNTGKIDNCVMTVHLTATSFAGDFRTLVESELYLPKSWHEDRERCRAAKIPDEVVYRSKYHIALDQLDRAAAHGVNFSWITADEWYSQKPAFVAGLEQRGLRYVLEVPRNFAVWLHDPRAVRTNGPAKSVENLLRHSGSLLRQPWRPYRIKDTNKGPQVWEVKFAPCWLPRAGNVVGPYWLVVARNVLNRDEVKFFVSNAAAGVPLPVVLHVAFGRWPVERCLQDEKSELGLSHFEVRCYPALKRHLLITQVSHLFLVRQTERLRGEKSGGEFAASSPRHQRGDRFRPTAAAAATKPLQPSRRNPAILATPQRTGETLPHKDPPPTARTPRLQPRPTPPLRPRLNDNGAL
ncbi:MAG: IS701 family transposase [Planctomycetaceae bacterium]